MLWLRQDNVLYAKALRTPGGVANPEETGLSSDQTYTKILW